MKQACEVVAGIVRPKQLAGAVVGKAYALSFPHDVACEFCGTARMQRLEDNRAGKPRVFTVLRCKCEAAQMIHMGDKS